MCRCVVICLLGLLGIAPGAWAQGCQGSEVAVQILGSSGPRVTRDRASSSYLVWLDGRSRILVDAGGGSYLRFGQAGARTSDLSLIAISHFHPDHVSDLPALLWSENVRQEPLAIAGPSGNEAVPGLSAFLQRLFDPSTGAFQVLGGSLGGTSGRGVRLEAGAVDVAKEEPTIVLDQPGVSVTAIGIPHGNIPALAYRVKAGNRTIVFSTDQTGTNPRFTEFARGADVLVMHLAIAAGGSSALHASPAVVGRVAGEADVARLVLGHIGQFDLDAAVSEVKQFYAGPLTVGADLQCTPVP